MPDTDDNHSKSDYPIPQPGSKEYQEAQEKMAAAMEREEGEGDEKRYYYPTPYKNDNELIWPTLTDFMSLTYEQRKAAGCPQMSIRFYAEGVRFPSPDPWIQPAGSMLLPGYGTQQPGPIMLPGYGTQQPGPMMLPGYGTQQPGPMMLPGYGTQQPGPMMLPYGWLFQYIDPRLNRSFFGDVFGLGYVSADGMGACVGLKAGAVSVNLGEDKVDHGSCGSKEAAGTSTPVGVTGAIPDERDKTQDALQAVVRANEMFGGAAAVAVPHNDVVFEDEFGIVLRKDGEDIRLSNFRILPVEFQIIKEKTPPERKVFIVEVHCEGERGQVAVPVEELDKLVQFVKRRMPTCFIYEEVPGASTKIVRHVRKLIRTVPHIRIYRCVGWERIQGQWIYVHDGVIPPSPDIRFETGMTIEGDPNLTGQSAFQAVDTLMGLSDDLAKSGSICLYAHLGILWRLFEESGYPPHLLLFLNGATGSLKTAAALAAFDLFGAGIRGAGSFRDTETALELKMGASRDSVLILDDFCPPVSRVNGLEQERKLELLVRFYGDGKGKSRGTASLQMNREFPPEGLCAITGENIGGTRSSLLRCVLVSVEKGTIKSDMLKLLQDNPRWLSTHYLRFLQWVGQNFENLKEKIHLEFPKYREAFSALLRERRLADAGAFLTITADILLSYGVQCGGLVQVEYMSKMQALQDAVKRVLAESEQSTQTADPVWMYLVALEDGMRRGLVRLADSRELYLSAPGQYVGYQENGKWWLCPNDMFLIAQRYWRQLGRVFPLAQEKIHAALASAGVSETQTERRENGERTVYLIRTTLPSRPRFLALYPDQVNAILRAAEQGASGYRKGYTDPIMFSGQNGQGEGK